MPYRNKKKSTSNILINNINKKKLLIPKMNLLDL